MATRHLRGLLRDEPDGADAAAVAPFKLMDGINTDTQARRIELTGHVQGVGFRPFVFRLAQQHQLSGWVRNQLGQVEVLVQGPPDALDDFTRDLISLAPPLADPRIARALTLPPAALTDFCILASSTASDARIFVPADQFSCNPCLAEIADHNDRRYRYPFTNCTNCGPRYTLITAMPYDRANTTMAGFSLCNACQAEYEDPRDRRFHAEPVACSACGPEVCFAADGLTVHGNDPALAAAVTALKDGRVVAVKGIGGYHLMCDARSETAVARLRSRKQRPDKPLAVMFPSAGPDGLTMIRAAVHLASAEADALTSPLRPILLAKRRGEAGLANNIAPGLAELGVFLPYSPLHALLLSDFAFPLVATSGNLSGEPVLTDSAEADRRLAQVADGFLHHNRPIQRPADDSVLRTIAERPRPLRLGRGAAPLELTLPKMLPAPMLAVGGHMKGAIALAWDNRVVVSPHIGEMDSPRSLQVFETLINDLQRLYGVTASRLVCDLHPGYSTHRWARRSGFPVATVQHHHAHASALAGEHPGEDPLLVFTWDGVGYGDDGTLWGGETLLGAPGRWQRVASMRPFFLPGGERAGREPWRSAAALCWETAAELPRMSVDTELANTAWVRRINTPESSAVGRIFDAAAALVLGVEKVSYEGQGPMQLESLAVADAAPIALPLRTDAAGVSRVDWSPLLPMLSDSAQSPRERAERFHSSLAHNIAEQARAARDRHAVNRVGLTGGVFQNRRLVAQARDLLTTEGFTVLLHHKLPCNDGGLSFGQIIEQAAAVHEQADNSGRHSR